ncbi:hypothetical protein NDU88_005405 [Pleurodeles waltl]|uniref:Uncharacterized protein n=1 Tax=Pleurodeles waltl TaxID=8319 RepID=A0AAV7WUM9_PLEWA|nr:hypothetical protein NDU88_005405 [Pleurodeles waltl]
MTAVEHSQRFDEILNAVLHTKTTLEPKIDPLQMDMDHMREDHKKLKERVEAMESTMASLKPTVTDATSHIRLYRRRWLNYDKERRIKKEDPAATIIYA